MCPLYSVASVIVGTMVTQKGTLGSRLVSEGKSVVKKIYEDLDLWKKKMREVPSGEEAVK